MDKHINLLYFFIYSTVLYLTSLTVGSKYIYIKVNFPYLICEEGIFVNDSYFKEVDPFADKTYGFFTILYSKILYWSKLRIAQMY